MKQIPQRTRRLLSLLLALCLGLALLPCAAQAAEEPQKVVRVGYFEDNDGFQSGFSDSEPKSGYAYEYYQELAKYTGWKYEYVYGSWSDVYQKLTDGDVDIMGGVSRLPERLGEMLFPDNIMGVESYYIFVPSDKTEIRAGDPQSLDGKRIGVNGNSYQMELLNRYTAENAPGCTVIAYNGTEERMAALRNGELDGVVTVDNYTIDGLKPVFKLGSSDYYFAVSRQRPDLLAELNTAQEKILSDSPYYMSTLQKKYFNTSVVREALTDDERAWLAAHPTLRLGYLNHCLPYCGQEEKTGAAAGMLAEILPELEKFTGCEILAVGFDTLPELHEAMAGAEIDAAFPASGDIWIAENQDYIQSRSLAGDRLAVVFRGEFKDSVFERIAISDQSSIQPLYLSVKYPGAQTVERADLKACLDAVSGGEAGCCLVSSNVLFRYRAESGSDSALHTAYTEDSVDYCFAVRRSSTTLYTILNKAIASVDETRINNAVIQNANIEAPYSLRSFLEHNLLLVFLFLGLIFLLLILIFAAYRRKSLKNQKQLQEAYLAANKAAEAKTVFLSTMSHDIRTPMNAIVNLTALAREEVDDREKLLADLGKIDVSNKFLLGLINDILDISKIESGSLSLRRTPYPYERFRRYIQSVVQPLCDSKNIRFVMSGEQPGVCLYTDEVRFNQILFNLLSNAVKYSEPGSEVALRMENVRIEDGLLHIDFLVSDHGAGMSPEFQKKLFTPFERENGGDARMGTGLGLAITKRIVDAMGGTIRVESAKGVGTTVTVHLDLELTEEPDAPQRQPDVPPDQFLRGRRVLVAEDHPMNREIITRILEAGGLSVEVAADGTEALAAFRRSAVGEYDAILMDIRMPVMNGVDSARAIRALDRADAKTVPILATTAEAFEQEKEEILSAGMNGHLAKPIDPAQLYQTIADAIRAAERAGDAC